MLRPGDNPELIEPFIEHQGERRGFWLRKPRPIGEKILLARTGRSVPDCHGHRAVVFLDCRSAFGTGGHGTTEGCLVALEKSIKGGEAVLDVGTGTGILAIAAHKLGAGAVTAIDIAGAACAETRRNAASNGIGREMTVIEGGVESVRGRFDIVVANLRTPLLAELLNSLIDRVDDGGTAIFSGILERELHPFLSLLDHRPLEAMEIKRIHGWMTLIFKKETDPP